MKQKPAPKTRPKTKDEFLARAKRQEAVAEGRRAQLAARKGVSLPKLSWDDKR